MSIKEKIINDMKKATKEGRSLEKTTLRMLLSEFQYTETSHSKDYVLKEEELYKIIQSYNKKLNKSLNDYPEGEQKQKIEDEINIVSSYLPKPPTRKEVEAAVEKALQESKDKNFGKLMKKTLTLLGPFADAKTVSEVIKEKLK